MILRILLYQSKSDLVVHHIYVYMAAYHGSHAHKISISMNGD